MTQVLISKELRTLSVPANLIPVEQYDEILKDIELEYQAKLAHELCLAEQAQIDADLEEYPKLLEALAIEEQAQIDAWDAYIKSLNDLEDEEQTQIDAWDAYIKSLDRAEYIDITPVDKFPIEKKPDSFSITEKEIFIEEVEEITLGTVKTLIFGRNIGTKGVVVSESQWQSLLTDSVSKRFPEGYTKIDSEGLWKGGKEKSNAILFACSDTSENKEKLTQIVKEYCNKFNQDAVLKINSDGVGSLLQIKQEENNA